MLIADIGHLMAYALKCLLLTRVHKLYLVTFTFQCCVSCSLGFEKMGESMPVHFSKIQVSKGGQGWKKVGHGTLGSRQQRKYHLPKFLIF